MATLFDMLQKAQAGQASGTLAPEQQQIEAAVAAKSGKAAAPGATPKASNLGESQALGQAAAGSAQVQLQATSAAADTGVQAANLATQSSTFQAGQQAAQADAASALATKTATVHEGIAARELQVGQRLQADETLKIQATSNAAEQKLRELTTNRRIALDDIFSEFEHGNEELDFRRDGAKLEQAGFLLAMRDKKYLGELDRVARARGLEDDLAFREEAFRLTFGNELSDLMDNLGFQSKYNTDQRAFERQLKAIDAGWAAQMASAAVRDANNRAVVEGSIATGKAGLDYAARDKTKKTPTQDGVTYDQHAALED